MKKLNSLVFFLLLFPLLLIAQAEKTERDIDSFTAVLEKSPSAGAIEEYVYLANKAAYVKPERVEAMEEVIRKAGNKTGYRFAENRAIILRIIAYINVSEFDTANLLLEQLKAQALKINDEKGLLQYYINKGILAKRTGKYELSAQMYYNGLALADKLNDQRHKLALYNNLTALFNAIQQHDKAKQMVFEALKIAASTSVETATGMGGIYANLAVIYKRTHQPDSALYFYKKAKSEFEQDGSTLVSGIYCNIGILYGSLMQLDSAEIYLQQALVLVRRFRQVNYEINTLNALAEIRFAQKKYDDAIVYANQAATLARTSGGLQALHNALQLLHTAHAKKGDYKKAYAFYVQAGILSDSLYSAEKEAIIGEVKEKYESDRKDEQIIIAGEKIAEQKTRMYYLFGVTAFIAALAAFTGRLYYRTGRLNRRIAAQSRAIQAKNADLAHVNQVKDKLFAVVSHDLRAPVSSLHALMTLINNPQLSADKMEQMKMQLQTQLHQTTGLMETLLHWAKTQMQGWEVKTDAVKLDRITGNIQNQFAKPAEEKGVMLQLKTAEQTPVVKADEQLLYIVLYNLVSNALKFTGTGGKVWMEIVTENNQVQLSVCDTGSGIDEKDLEGLFDEDHYRTTPGTANEKGFGLGLKICMELAWQMNATITAQSQKGKGSRFVVHLPIS